MEIFKSEHLSRSDESVTTVDWIVPETLFYFDGHFPHNPVLPAVAIVDLSVQLVQFAFPKKIGALQNVPNAKFSVPLRPGTPTQIRAERDGENEWSVNWKDVASGETAAILRLRFQAV